LIDQVNNGAQQGACMHGLHFWARGLARGYAGLCGVMRGYAGLCGVMRGYAGLCGVMRGYADLRVVMCLSGL
jgi:hypothetical protein